MPLATTARYANGSIAPRARGATAPGSPTRSSATNGRRRVPAARSTPSSGARRTSAPRSRRRRLRFGGAAACAAHAAADHRGQTDAGRAPVSPPAPAAPPPARPAPRVVPPLTGRRPTRPQRPRPQRPEQEDFRNYAIEREFRPTLRWANPTFRGAASAPTRVPSATIIDSEKLGRWNPTSALKTLFPPKIDFPRFHRAPNLMSCVHPRFRLKSPREAVESPPASYPRVGIEG